MDIILFIKKPECKIGQSLGLILVAFKPLLGYSLHTACFNPELQHFSLEALYRTIDAIKFETPEIPAGFQNIFL